MGFEWRYECNKDLMECVADLGEPIEVCCRENPFAEYRAALIKAIGLGNTILLGVAIYLAWQYWDKIMAFFA